MNCFEKDIINSQIDGIEVAAIYKLVATFGALRLLKAVQQKRVISDLPSKVGQAEQRHQIL